MFRMGDNMIDDYFDEIWLSYKLHKMKPGKEIFEHILENSGIKPEETLFIDDAPANCTTAQKFGIMTYQALPKEDWREALDKILMV